MSWQVRTIHGKPYRDEEPQPEWRTLHVTASGLPQSNEDIEATEQSDGSLLILDIKSGVERIVVDQT